MKSNEFITENESDAMDIRYWSRKIKQNCQPFLQQSKGNHLFRGVKARTYEQFIDKDVRLTDRMPKDSSSRLHHKYNEYFTTEFGEPFRNAIFCSGKSSEASEYGRVFSIFPVGDFSFIWSKTVPDLFGRWQDYEPLRHNDMSHEEYLERREDEEDRFFKKEIYNKYTNKNLATGIRSGNEIMVRCGNYYGINQAFLELYHDELMGLIYEK